MILCLQHLSSNSEMPFNKVRSIMCALKEHEAERLGTLIVLFVHDGARWDFILDFFFLI